MAPTRAIAVIAVFAAALLCPLVVEARPGGGQSYSGGSSGGSSSGSSSSSSSSGSGSSSSGSAITITMDPDAVILGYTVETLVYGLLFGGIGLAVSLSVVSGVVEQVKKGRRGGSDDWDSRKTAKSSGPRFDPWETVRPADPDFSAVLFDDFVYTLYATAHRARHDLDALARLSPYLSPDVRAVLHNRIPQGAPVVAVIVGAVRVTAVTMKPGGEQVAAIEVEANLSVRAPDGMRGEYVRDRWTLSRVGGGRTRAWTGVRTLGCPACGAPFAVSGDDRCASCGQVVAGGRFDWQVVDTSMLEWDARPPALLGEGTEEKGTDRATVVDTGLRAAMDALGRDDPAFSGEALFDRVRTIFVTLNESWAAQDLRLVRPYVSDAMFNYLSYWTEAYRAQGLRNAVESARVLRLEHARIRRDRHFDAVTIRLWGTGFEVTTEAATDRVLRGSRRRERPYSEYWTLIRGAAVRGAPRADPKCPSCGAPLDVNMAGQCEHCGVHVTSGEFDWVLSRIEQDDSYEG